MKGREIGYLVLNIPFCLGLFVVLLILNEGLSYKDSNWNPNNVEVSIGIFIIMLLLDLVIMGFLKILNWRILLLTITELAIISLLVLLF